MDESLKLANEKLKQAEREMAEELDRALILAFHRGYDGADEFISYGAWDDGEYTFKLRSSVKPWVGGNEPKRPPWANHHRRHSFEGVTYQDLRDFHEGDHD